MLLGAHCLENLGWTPIFATFSWILLRDSKVNLQNHKIQNNLTRNGSHKNEMAKIKCRECDCWSLTCSMKNKNKCENKRI